MELFTYSSFASAILWTINLAVPQILDIITIYVASICKVKELEIHHGKHSVKAKYK